MLPLDSRRDVFLFHSNEQTSAQNKPPSATSLSEIIDLTDQPTKEPYSPGTPVTVCERSRTAGDYRPAIPPPLEKTLRSGDKSSAPTLKRAISSGKDSFDEPHPTQFDTLKDRIFHIGGKIALTREAKPNGASSSASCSGAHPTLEHRAHCI